MEVAGPLGTPLGLAQRKRMLDSLEAAQVLCRSVHQALKGAPWVVSCSVYQCVQHLMGQRHYCSQWASQPSKLHPSRPPHTFSGFT